MNDKNTFRTVDETIRQQFESGWAAGNPQPIEELVGQPTSDNYLATLEELVHIELEFRWKDRDPLGRPQLEDYLERFEPLADSAILSRLVAQEIKLRLALGETPTSAEYEQRFPEATVEIPATDQGAQDTGVKSEDDVDTQHEMPTMAPESGTDSRPGSDPLDSATLAGPEQQAKRKIILEGDFVPGYDLLGELGRGGMGVVYQARDQKLKRVVALKMILSGVHASEEDMQRFQTEAEAVAKLQHPNIVQIFEVGEHKGNPYISLEYQEGGGLDNKIGGTPQNIEESAQLIETLAQAMQVAHQEDIIHRDLKPANILLSADGEPKITDFGLAKRMDEDSNQTKSGAVMGTPSYMAPEQASSSNETIGPAADTYALGAILYHLLTGRPPFRAETQLDTLMQVISDEPLPPKRLNSKVPADLETICLKCLQKDIKRRYTSCEELAEDLRRFQAGEPIAARPVSAIERGWKWTKRRPAIAGMIGVSIVAAVALVVGGFVYNGKLVKEKNFANSQSQLAENEADRANEARTEAVAAQQATEAERKRTAQILYGTNISLAYRSWLANDPKRAEQLLNECPAEYRNWEWDYLQSLNHTEAKTLFGHTGIPGFVHFAKNGQRVVTVGLQDRLIKLWDVTSGTELLSTGVGSFPPVIDLDLAGETLLVNHGTLCKLISVKTGQELIKLGETGESIKEASFIDDDRKVATAYDDGSVIIYDAKTGKETQRCPKKLKSGGPDFGRYQFSADGTLVAGREEKAVVVWNVDTGEVKFTADKLHTTNVNYVLSADGSTLVTSASYRRFLIWNVESGKQINTIHFHEHSVSTASISSDGTMIVVGAGDRTCRIYDTKTADEILVIRGHALPIANTAFNDDGTMLATASHDGTVKLWKIGGRLILAESLKNPKRDNSQIRPRHGGGLDLVTLFGHEAPVYGVSSSPDGKLVATSGMGLQLGDEQIKVWSIADRSEFASFPTPGGLLHTLAFSPDSQFLAVTTGGAGDQEHQGSTTVWNLETKKKVLELEGAPCMLSQAAFSADGKTLAVVYGSLNLSTIQTWSFPSGKKLHQIPIANERLASLAFSPDSTLLFTGSVPGDLIRVWDVATGKEKKKLSSAMGVSPGVFRIAMSSQGVLAAAHLDGLITLWDASTIQPIGELTGHNSYAVDLVFNPDGKRLLSCSEDLTAKLWDTVTLRELLTFRDHADKIYGVAWSGDGKTIASVGKDGALKLRGIKHPTGTSLEQEETWVTFYEDDFQRKEPGDSWNWSAGHWFIEDGWLTGDQRTLELPGVQFPAAFIQLIAEDLPKTVDISVDVRMLAPMLVDITLTNNQTRQQISPFVAPTAVPFGIEGVGIFLNRYSPSKGNAETRVIKGSRSTKLKQGTTYRLRVVRKIDTLSFYIDGVLVHSDNVPAFEAQTLQIGGSWSQVSDRIQYDNLVIRAPARALQQRKVRSLVEGWFEETLLPDVVRERIHEEYADSKKDLDYALSVAALLKSDLQAVLRASFKVSMQTDATPEQYNLAYRQAMHYLETGPKDARLILHVAYAMLRVNKHDDAIELLDQALIISKREIGFAFPHLIAARALCLHALGRKEEAKQEHQRFLDLQLTKQLTDGPGLSTQRLELEKTIPLKESPERREILETIIGANKALWIDRDVATHFAVRSSDFIATMGRSDQVDKHDQQMDRLTDGKRKTLLTMSAFPSGWHFIWTEIDVVQKEDQADVSCNFIVSHDDGYSTTGHHYQLVKRDNKWLVTGERRWPVVWKTDDDLVSYNQQTWQTHDQQADELLKAGEFTKASEAFKKGWRPQDAYDAAQRQIGEDSPKAADYVRLGDLACLSGHFKEGTKALQQALQLDPSVMLPPYMTRLEGIFAGHRGPVFCSALNPDGKTLATASQDLSVKIWDRKTRKVLKTLENAHGKLAAEVTYTPNGGILVSAGHDAIVRTWEPNSGERLQQFGGHIGAIFRLGIHPSQNQVVSSSADNTAKIWDLDKNRTIRSLVGHSESVLCAEFSPDGSKIATASRDKTVKIWDTQTGKVLASLTQHTGAVYRVNWSPDGDRLASCGEEKTVKIWDAKSFKLLHTLTGHTDTIETVVISPDGKTAASGGYDHEIRIWDLDTARTIAVLRGHGGPIYNLRFDKKGKSLFSASGDGTVREWNVDLESNLFSPVLDLSLD